MNERFKFRAWVIKEGIMIQHPNRAPAVRLFTDSYAYTNKEVVIEQFTGLHDRNGTEIYEGDILKRGDFPDEQPRYIVRFGKFTDSLDIYYEQEYIGWYVDEIGKQDEYRNPLTYIVGMLDGVVCGNIHENPELLERD